MERFVTFIILFLLSSCGVPDISGLKIFAPTTEVNRGESITFSTDKTGMDSYVWKYKGSKISECKNLMECTIEFKVPSTFEENIVSLTVTQELKDKSGTVTEVKSKKVSTTITVNNTPPILDAEQPSLITFVDDDYDYKQIGGDITIIGAYDETFVSFYIFYWGNDEGRILESIDPIGSVLSDGSQTYSISLDDNTVIPEQAHYVLVFSHNEVGRMEQGIFTAIGDTYLEGSSVTVQSTASEIGSSGTTPTTTSSPVGPVNKAVSITFVDVDPSAGEISGTATITPALDESDITHYALYWGSDATTKVSGIEAITFLEKTGLALTYVFSEDTSLPTGTTYLVVLTKNATGEMTEGISVAIYDVRSGGAETTSSGPSTDSSSSSSEVTPTTTDSSSGGSSSGTSSGSSQCSGTFSNSDDATFTPAFTFNSDTSTCTGVVDYTDPATTDMNFSGTCEYDGSNVIISYEGLSPLNGKFNSACTTVTVDSVDYTKQ